MTRASTTDIIVPSSERSERKDILSGEREILYLKPLVMSFVACKLLVDIPIAVIVSKALPGFVSPIMDCI